MKTDKNKNEKVISDQEYDDHNGNNTFLDHFQNHLDLIENKRAYTFLDDNLNEVSKLSYKELDQKARRISAALQKNYSCGDRIALLFPSGTDFICAFYACMYSGVIAVPIYPPRSSKANHLARIRNILLDSGAKGILTTEQYKERISQVFLNKDFKQDIQIHLINYFKSDYKEWKKPNIKKDDIVFLQYTSGSTGNPKGVMVTHKSLMHNESFIKKSYRHTEDMVLVGWLPFYHDMGLIGNILQPSYCGGHAILMDPMTFLRKPENWLIAIGKYKAVTSGGPNFSYQLCVDRIDIDELETLDLSCWVKAFTGAEPIRARTLKLFSEKFSSCGFKKSMFHSGYGLAEATLQVSSTIANNIPMEVSIDQKMLVQHRVKVISEDQRSDRASFVSSGELSGDLEVRIVDTETNTICEREAIGEVWVSGGSIAKGYWNQPELTEKVFHGCIGDDLNTRYLRTGDLGFVLQQNLFITGRLKDLIIIRGQNHAPEDIEQTAFSASKELQADGGAAFSVDAEGHERLILVQEVKRTKIKTIDCKSVSEVIKKAVLQQHKIGVDQIILVKPKSLPKTTSGKIRRQQCKKDFLNNKFIAIGQNKQFTNSSNAGLSNGSTSNKFSEPDSSSNESEVLAKLIDFIQKITGLPAGSLASAIEFNSLGLDSLKVVEMHYQIENEFHASLELEILYTDKTLLDLAKEIYKVRELTVSQELHSGESFEVTDQNILKMDGRFEAPISENQKGLVYMSQSQADVAIYNIPVAIHIYSIIDVDFIKDSLVHLINRHCVLRSRFRLELDGNTQIFEPHISLNELDRYLEVVDYRSKEPEHLDKIIRFDAQKPFNLTSGPLMRVKLYLLPDSQSVLLMTNHHIITDLSSLLILFNEFFQIYSQLNSKNDKRLNEIGIDYVGYTAWLKSWLKQPIAQEAREYWLNELKGELPALDLPMDRPRAHKRSYCAASQRFELSIELKKRLQEIARNYKTSLYAVLLSAYQVLLCRLSGQDEVVIGSPTSAHTHPDFSNLVGYCLNPVILRAKISSELKFSTLLKQNRTRVLKALKYQFYPLQRVLDELEVSYPQNIAPYFQTLFYLYKPGIKPDISTFIAGANSEKISFGGLEITPYKFDSVAVEYDLNMWLVDSSKGLLGEIAYNSDLFDNATMQRLSRHYCRLLESIAGEPDASVYDYNILSKSEYHQMVECWSKKKHEFQPSKTLSQLFEAQVRKTPNAVALQIDDAALSYEELDSKSNQLAHYLLSQGVEPGMLIGLCLPRCVNLLVSILAILKTGSAYVPLDPDYPQERLKHIVKDANLKTVITQQSQLAVLPNNIESAINLSNAHSRIIKCAQTAPNVEVNVKDLAYIIYTSGSTGNPNGVMISNGNVVRLMQATENIFDFNEFDTWTFFHSYAFDFSVWEIWGALLYGGRLIIVPYWISRDAEAFYDLLIKEKVTVLNQTPSAFSQLISVDKERVERNLKNLRYIIFGGEALDFSSLQPWYRKYDNDTAKLVNMYGITETTVHTTFHFIQAHECEKEYQSIIGHALADIDLYILDKHMNPVAIGVTGELYVGGLALAKGYLNNEELTRARFALDPFSNNEQSRLYKTGDLARFDLNGQIHYMGRCDHQVKIRGFRIELGEIETCLAEHEYVQQAIVVLSKDLEIPDKALIAYIKASSTLNVVDKEALPGILKSRLKERLPNYMLPAYIIVLEKFPLTASGKIDVKSLLEMDSIKNRRSTQETGDFLEPRDGIESCLHGIWLDLFKLEKLGVKENFFELGGDSLMSNRMLIMAREAGIRLSLQDIFVNQTIESLAKVAVKESSPSIDGKTEDENFQRVIPDLSGRHDPFPLTDIQQAYWLGRQGEFNLGNIGTHSYAEVIFDDLDIDKFERCWNKLIERHEMLRMVVDECGRQRILESVPKYQIKVYKCINSSDQKTQNQLLSVRDELSHQVFSGSAWPLFDIRVTKVTEQEIVLHISMDMLTLDAASALILLRELSDLYASPDLNLPNLSLSFRDYVLAENQIRETELYRNSKDYWLGRVDVLPMSPDLPIAIDPANISEPRFERRQHTLNVLQWKRLKELCQRHRTTPTVFLLACMAEVLYIWSKQDHFSLNLTLFNRLPLHKQVDDIIGDFTSLTILEVDFRDKGLSTFSKRVEKLHAQLWQDLEHKYYSGVEVQRELSRHHGETINIPIVVTSAIGLPGVDGDESEQGRMRTNFFEKFSSLSYGITQTSQVWLDIQFSDMADKLTFNWDSVQGLFPVGMLDDMFAAFCKLLAQLADDDYAWSMPVFPLVPDKDLKLIESGNKNAKVFDQGLLHENLLKQIKINSDRSAVITKSRSLSFKELGIRGERLSAALINGGAKPNKLIAVLMEKGWEQVVAVLGILQSGAAYLPVDAALPNKRIKQLLTLGSVKQIVSVPDVISSLGLNEDYDIYLIEDDELSKDSGVPNDVYAPVQSNTDLAYVIFTSGSTGEPKGVMIDHKGAMNTIFDINSRFNVSDKDAVLGLSSLSFDLSVYDIFGVLGAGGTLVLPQADESRDPEVWLNYINRYKVSIWNTVPALMGILIEYAESKNERLALRLVLMSGDWIPVDLPNRIRNILNQDAGNDLSIISLGGATEASIWSVYYPIIETDPMWSSIPYGKALHNQSMLVLKSDLSPCPVWVSGDLYIGGEGLALGYWQDQEKTNASFILHPVTKKRLYKTGDMARLLPNGEIEFLGRSDFQVKLNGHRVELGEIESRLLEHKQIQEAVVTVRSENGRGQTLVAYVTNSKSERNISGQSSIDRVTSHVITDSADKLQFKFDQKSIRNLGYDYIQLPIKPSEQAINVLTRPSRHRYTNTGIISLNQLSELLIAYYRKEFDQYPIAKGYYPSSGSLYPIQTYLRINDGQILSEDGIFLDGGYYYYHPLMHRLMMMGTLSSADKISCRSVFDLFLLADYDAIEPMYGSLAGSFCSLEAGYMACLIESMFCTNLYIMPQNVNDIDFDVKKSFQLGDQHHLLYMGSGHSGNTVEQKNSDDMEKNQGFDKTTIGEKVVRTDQLVESIELSYQSRKSYRKFFAIDCTLEDIAYLLKAVSITVRQFNKSYCQDCLIDLFLCIRRPIIDDAYTLMPGYYHYDHIDQCLNVLLNVESERLESFFTGQEHIEHGSSIGIFIVGDRSKGKEGDRRFQSGYLGQMLNHYAIQREIGLCGIGYSSEEAAKKAFGLSSDQYILHSLLGGKVTQEQLNNLETESSEINISKTLKEFLSQYLPEYMVPTIYMPLEKMPLTSNGKVDRKALPEPDFGLRPDNQFVAAKTDTQKILHNIWRELLRVEKISIHDSFFELGGNSMDVVTLKRHIQEGTGSDVPMVKLFSHATIYDISEYIDKHSTDSKSTCEIPDNLIPEEYGHLLDDSGEDSVVEEIRI